MPLLQDIRVPISCKINLCARAAAFRAIVLKQATEHTTMSDIPCPVTLNPTGSPATSPEATPEQAPEGLKAQQPDKNRRDLEWAISSQALFDTNYLTHYLGDDTSEKQAIELWPHPRLAEQNIFDYRQNPLSQAVEHHLKQTASHFLGPRFEALWDFFFQQHPGYDVIARNLQVHEKPDTKAGKKSGCQGKTLGEFDFIVQDLAQKTCWHLETTVKFYLGMPVSMVQGRLHNHFQPRELTSVWLGPNCIDRLDKKLNTALHRQLTLSRHPAASALLRSMGVTTVKPGLLTRGYLFSPCQVKEAVHFFADDGLALRPDTSLWTRLRQLPDALASLTRKNRIESWLLLPKQEWLSPARLKNSQSDRLMATDDTVARVSQIVTRENRPWLVAGMMQQPDHSHMESLRLFVTPDAWPFL